MASLINMSGGSLLKKGLPYDYEVEYLESTGTQWIQTEIKPSQLLRVRDCYKCTGQLNVAGGSGLTGANCWAWGDREDGYFTINLTNTNRWVNLKERDYNIHVFDYKSGSQYIDGTLIGNITFTGSESFFGMGILLFARYSYNTNRYNAYQQCQRYYTQMWNGNTLVRDFIPVVKDNIGYMYDKVSGTLFGNAGTGNFILGPEV